MDSVRRYERPNSRKDSSELGIVRVDYKPAPDAEDRLRRLHAFLNKLVARDGEPVPQTGSSPGDGRDGYGFGRGSGRGVVMRLTQAGGVNSYLVAFGCGYGTAAGGEESNLWGKGSPWRGREVPEDASAPGSGWESGWGRAEYSAGLSGSSHGV